MEIVIMWSEMKQFQKKTKKQLVSIDSKLKRPLTKENKLNGNFIHQLVVEIWN